MSLAFMIKAHSSQDCRSIRILSIKMGLAYAIMNTNNQVENLHDHFDHFQYLSEMGGGGGGGGGEWVFTWFAIEPQRKFTFLEFFKILISRVLCTPSQQYTAFNFVIDNDL